MDAIPGSTVHLVDAARRGDDRSLDALFTRFLPRVRQIVSLRLGWRLRQLVDLEDVVQDVMIRAIKGLESFIHTSDGSFQNWLARCVQSEIADQARAAGRRKRGGARVRRFGDCSASILHSSIFADEGPTPSDIAGAAETAERLEEALLRLPDYQRELIILRAVCGMSYEEVARELKIANDAAVRVAYSRALKKLKESAGLE